jgi:hypothetical protein
MNLTIRAGIAALSIASIAPAFAGEAGTDPVTFFTQLPGVVAQAPAQHAPAIGSAKNGQTALAYVTQSNRGTWLFQPHDGGGSNG